MADDEFGGVDDDGSGSGGGHVAVAANVASGDSVELDLVLARHLAVATATVPDIRHTATATATASASASATAGFPAEALHRLSELVVTAPLGLRRQAAMVLASVAGASPAAAAELLLPPGCGSGSGSGGSHGSGSGSGGSHGSGSGSGGPHGSGSGSGGSHGSGGSGSGVVSGVLLALRQAAAHDTDAVVRGCAAATLAACLRAGGIALDRMAAADATDATDASDTAAEATTALSDHTVRRLPAHHHLKSSHRIPQSPGVAGELTGLLSLIDATQLSVAASAAMRALISDLRSGPYMQASASASSYLFNATLEVECDDDMSAQALESACDVHGVWQTGGDAEPLAERLRAVALLAAAHDLACDTAVRSGALTVLADVLAHNMPGGIGGAAQAEQHFGGSRYGQQQMGDRSARIDEVDPLTEEADAACEALAAVLAGCGGGHDLVPQAPASVVRVAVAAVKSAIALATHQPAAADGGLDDSIGSSHVNASWAGVNNGGSGGGGIPYGGNPGAFLASALAACTSICLIGPMSAAAVVRAGLADTLAAATGRSLAGPASPGNSLVSLTFARLCGLPALIERAAVSRTCLHAVLGSAVALGRAALPQGRENLRQGRGSRANANGRQTLGGRLAARPAGASAGGVTAESVPSAGAARALLGPVRALACIAAGVASPSGVRPELMLVDAQALREMLLWRSSSSSSGGGDNNNGSTFGNNNGINFGNNNGGNFGNNFNNTNGNNASFAATTPSARASGRWDDAPQQEPAAPTRAPLLDLVTRILLHPATEPALLAPAHSLLTSICALDASLVMQMDGFGPAAGEPGGVLRGVRRVVQHLGAASVLPLVASMTRTGSVAPTRILDLLGASVIASVAGSGARGTVGARLLAEMDWGQISSSAGFRDTGVASRMVSILDAHLARVAGVDDDHDAAAVNTGEPHSVELVRAASRIVLQLARDSSLAAHLAESGALRALYGLATHVDDGGGDGDGENDDADSTTGTYTATFSGMSSTTTTTSTSSSSSSSSSFSPSSSSMLESNIEAVDAEVARDCLAALGHLAATGGSAAVIGRLGRGIDGEAGPRGVHPALVSLVALMSSTVPEVMREAAWCVAELCGARARGPATARLLRVTASASRRNRLDVISAGALGLFNALAYTRDPSVRAASAAIIGGMVATERVLGRFLDAGGLFGILALIRGVAGGPDDDDIQRARGGAPPGGPPTASERRAAQLAALDVRILAARALLAMMRSRPDSAERLMDAGGVDPLVEIAVATAAASSSSGGGDNNKNNNSNININNTTTTNSSIYDSYDDESNDNDELRSRTSMLASICASVLARGCLHTPMLHRLHAMEPPADARAAALAAAGAATSSAGDSLMAITAAAAAAHTGTGGAELPAAAGAATASAAAGRRRAVLVTVIERVGDDEQHCAALALAHMARNTREHAALLAVGCIPIILSSALAPDPAIARAASLALGRLLAHPPNRAKILVGLCILVTVMLVCLLVFFVLY
jgi:hypothetical protein